MLFVVLCFSACAGTRKDWIITGGNQANGIVEMSYQYTELEVPHVNDAQAQVVANLACHEWGYSSSKSFGRRSRIVINMGDSSEVVPRGLSRVSISALVARPVDELGFEFCSAPEGELRFVHLDLRTNQDPTIRSKASNCVHARGPSRSATVFASLRRTVATAGKPIERFPNDLVANAGVIRDLLNPEPGHVQQGASAGAFHSRLVRAVDGVHDPLNDPIEVVGAVFRHRSCTLSLRTPRHQPNRARPARFEKLYTPCSPTGTTRPQRS